MFLNCGTFVRTHIVDLNVAHVVGNVMGNVMALDHVRWGERRGGGPVYNDS